MATVKAKPKRPALSRKSARNAAKQAQVRFSKVKGAPKTPAWKKGGREWVKALGHFGISA